MAQHKKPKQTLPKTPDPRTAPEGAAAREHTSITAHWAGPLPPPAVLREFNDIIPNGAERILRMAKVEQTHRHKCDEQGLQMENAAVRRGQWLGAGVSALSIAGATWSALAHAHWVATAALVGVPVLGIIRAIVRHDR